MKITMINTITKKKEKKTEIILKQIMVKMKIIDRKKIKVLKEAKEI